jgi:hypothetical protein
MCNRNLLIFGLIFLFAWLPATNCLALGQSTEVINYQGRLTGADGRPVTDTVTASFALFDIAYPTASHTPLWHEDNIQVSVEDGIYNVELGSHVSFPAGLFRSNENLYLQVTMNGERMEPLHHITSTAFSMRAIHADTATSADTAQEANHAATASTADWAVNIENGTIPNDLHIDGKLGIGTNSPRTDLEVEGSSGLRVTTGQYSSLYGEFKHGADQGLIINSNAGGAWADIRFQSEGIDRMFIDNGGNVGIGTTTPGARLEISGDGSSWADGFMLIKNEGEDAGIQIHDSNIGVMHHIFNDTHFFNSLRICPADTYTSGGITITQGGYVGIGTGNQLLSTMLTVNGSIKLTGGGDISEPFDFNHPDMIRPGMVVSIDPEKAGHLKPSSGSYDHGVAGIVSGAGGVKPGLLMMQQGVLEGDHQVALVGRVYGLCDAAYGAIKPGDLLTTSPTPGYAMKVTDYTSARGAILGKAMTKLDKGKDLVLVLVGLQ